MNTIDFLSHIRSLDINLFVEDQRLCCNAPEGVLTAELRAEISNRKSEIIAFLKTANFKGISPSISIEPRLREVTFPLSFAQQRLWFLDQLVPQNPFYNIPAAVRLTGYLNLSALEKTFNEIMRRHEALRTCFEVVEGQAIPKISDNLSLEINFWDLQNFPKNEREQEGKRLTNEEVQHPFNLSSDLLLRVTLLRFEESEHLLILNMHHIVADGWSIGVFIQELGVLYTAFASGKPSPLPELSIQYADFARWQRERLQGEVLEIQLAYWRQQLNGISMLNLPTDRPRPAVQTYQGKTQFLQFSKKLSEELEVLSQREEATLFMTLLAAFQTLLYRYTQEEDIVIGFPIANRNRTEIEGLIGFFVNTLVLRTDLSGNPSFVELLQRVKKVALGAYAHQDLPFEKLVEELHPERALNQNPLFQVVFALQNAPMERLELPELILSSQQLDARTARFDLEFHLWDRSPNNKLWVDTSDGISGFVIYSADLFDEATIVRMLDHFKILLEDIVANPHTRISQLQLLTEAERKLLIVEGNKKQAIYPQNLCIQQLFEAQAEQTPDAVALVFADEQVTYRELNIRSNQLAHYLQKLGVEADVLVGLCVERSLDLIVGMLGILKAGGAYLPLDPTYPPDRLSFMLEDAQVRVLITCPKFLPMFNDKNFSNTTEKTNLNPRINHNLTISEERNSLANDQVIHNVNIQSSGQLIVICLHQDLEAIIQESPDNPTSGVTAKNLAYVIYTSGSTGKPKGVEIEHRSLLNLIFWHQKEFNILPCDRATQISGISFDACGWEIWPYLAIGASIYFADEETKRSPEQLRSWLVAKAITISFLPTPLAEKVLGLDWPPSTALRILLTGGEKLQQYPLASLPFKIINNYGPTENTVVTTSALVPPKKPSDLAPTIGRPITNIQVYILDRYLQPVPIGVPGELYIGGDGLARGYLNRPDLTTERFLVNPFISCTQTINPDSKIYKTGDLVRYKADGNLEFLGRIDEQVKIRGFRIELGEIEVVLAQHPAVQQTVVMNYEQGQGEQRLVAYITLNPESTNLSEQTQQIPLQEEQVSQWKMLYNNTYNQPVADADPTFNIVGWNSSYTNQPIPAEEVRDWVHNQAAEILAFQPSRVLEIGCGTGLLLFRIAPHCHQYYGTDFSPYSLNYIRQHLENQKLANVTLQEKMATDWEGVEPGTFNAVILNSVVQYFPSINYLLQVLEGAVKATAPGGFVFIGDVRSLPLLEAFHASVQLYQAEPCVTRQQLRQRVQMQIFQETELVIDPDFFKTLKHRYPQIMDVKIQLIRGRFQNELTQFRYNAILQIAPDLNSKTSYVQVEKSTKKWLNWSKLNITLEKVRQLLVETQPDFLGIANVPNQRVGPAIKAAEWLSSTDKFKTVGQFLKAVEEIPDLGVNPEEWYHLEVPYTVYVTWSNTCNQGSYNVEFLPLGSLNKNFLMPEETEEKLYSLRSYANNPLQAQAARKFVPKLQTYLSRKLPDYMIPSAFVVLESLPLTSNGKVDRHALPAPEPTKLELVGGYAAPQTAIEEVLVKIWAEILGIKRVGIHDNFFELGGHSLLATQLVSRVRDAFGVELPLRNVFETPIIAEISQVVEGLKEKNTPNKIPTLLPVNRDSRRRKISSFNNEIK